MFNNQYSHQYSDMWSLFTPHNMNIIYQDITLLGGPNEDMHTIQTIDIIQDDKLEIYFIDIYFRVTILNYNVEIGPRDIVVNDRKANIYVNRGDCICIKWQQQYLIIQQKVYNDFFDLAYLSVSSTQEKSETQKPDDHHESHNKRSVSIKFKGQMLVKYNSGFEAFNNLCQKVNARTWYLESLDVWKKEIDMNALIKTEDMKALYMVLISLTMSPYNPELCYTKAAFQNHGFYGLVDYHQSQVLLAVEFFKALDYERLIKLLYFITRNVQMIQCGIASQIFRGLLIFYHFYCLRDPIHEPFNCKRTFLFNHDFTNNKQDEHGQEEIDDEYLQMFYEFGGKIDKPIKQENVSSGQQTLIDDILCSIFPIKLQLNDKWGDTTIQIEYISYTRFNKSQLLILACLHALLTKQVINEANTRFISQLTQEQESPYVSWYMRAYHRAYNVIYAGVSILEMMQDDLVIFQSSVSELISYNFYLEASYVPHTIPTAVFCALKHIQVENKHVKPILEILDQENEFDEQTEQLLLNWLGSLDPLSILICGLLLQRFSVQTRRKIIFVLASLQHSCRALKRCSNILDQYEFMYNCPNGFRLDGLGYLDEPPVEITELQNSIQQNNTDKKQKTQECPSKQINYNKVWRLMLLFEIAKAQYVLGTPAEPYIDMELYKKYSLEKQALECNFVDVKCDITTDFIEPTTQVNTVDQQDESSNDADEHLCMICMRALEMPVTLECTHILCAQCFGQYSTQCALCRAPVKSFIFNGEKYEGLEILAPSKIQVLQRNCRSQLTLENLYDYPFNNIRMSIVRGQLVNLRKLQNVFHFFNQQRADINIQEIMQDGNDVFGSDTSQYGTDSDDENEGQENDAGSSDIDMND